MINVSYSIVNKEVSGGGHLALLDRLPPFLQQQVLSFKRQEDALLSLGGKLLLLKSLQNLGYDLDVLNRLDYSAYRRPFLRGLSDLDFNISHAGRCVVCALSNTHRVGIDIERVEPIELSDFTSCLHPSEWSDIKRTSDSYARFFWYWTRKEAVTKADGMGLSLPLQRIVVQSDDIRIGTGQWFMKELPIHENYVCHLATNGPVEKLSLHSVNLNSIYTLA